MISLCPSFTEGGRGSGQEEVIAFACQHAPYLMHMRPSGVLPVYGRLQYSCYNHVYTSHSSDYVAIDYFVLVILQCGQKAVSPKWLFGSIEVVLDRKSVV